MNYYYTQLAGALGLLKQHGVVLDYTELNSTLRRIAAQHGPDRCDTDIVKSLHRTYRDLCLAYGLIRPGELFDVPDCVPLT